MYKVDEEKKFISELHTKYRLIYYIGRETGLRISDILRLRPSDVHRGILSVIAVKTKKPLEHKLPLWLLGQLGQYQKRHEIAENESYFKLSRQACWKEFKRAASAAGINKNVGTHSMRKRFAFDAYRRTKNLGEVCTLLQHDNIATTILYLFEEEESAD